MCGVLDTTCVTGFVVHVYTAVAETLSLVAMNHSKTTIQLRVAIPLDLHSSSQ